MAREIPEAVRAAAGLAATVLDEARKLPETLPGLPVRAISLAMQATMKLQQQYAGLVARGDEVFTGVLGDREPGLATFDDEVDDEPAPPAATPARFRGSAFDRADAPPEGDPDADLDAHATLEELAIEDLVDAGPTTAEVGGEGIGNALLDADGAAAATSAEGSTGAAGDLAPAAEPPVAEPAPALSDERPAVSEEPAAGSDLSGSQAAGTAPIDGYDGFSVAQLRGRLRGYAPSTVESLLRYEEATRAREPYLRMLRNRLERVRADST